MRPDDLLELLRQRPFRPFVRGDVEVEVIGVPGQAVEPDGVSAHDQAAQSERLQAAVQLGQALLGGHRSESSQPRLPRASSNAING